MRKCVVYCMPEQRPESRPNKSVCHPSSERFVSMQRQRNTTFLRNSSTMAFQVLIWTVPPSRRRELLSDLAQVDIVIAADSNRMSRNLSQLAFLQVEFEHAGVRLEFVTGPAAERRETKCVNLFAYRH
jgi:hypothetical protein